MMSGVLLMGDAGALTYVDDKSKDTFGGFCCDCTTPRLEERETSMATIKRKGISKYKKEQFTDFEKQAKRNDIKLVPKSNMDELRNSLRKVPFRWTQDVISKYSDTKAMLKKEDVGGRKLDARSRSRSGSSGRRSTQGSKINDPNHYSPVSQHSPSMMRMSMREVAEMDMIRQEQIGEKYNAIFDSMMKKMRAKLDQ